MARTFVKIYYWHEKQIKQENSCFYCQTFYDNLQHFIYFYSNFGQFFNISKFYGIVQELKKNILERHTCKFFFPAVFPGVKLHRRSFQEFPGVVATL